MECFHKLEANTGKQMQIDLDFIEVYQKES